MLTRSLYLAVGWFTISLLATLIGGIRLRRGNFLLSVPWLLCVLFAGDLWAILTFGVPIEILALSGIAFFLGLVFIVWLRDWNALGQVTWTMAILATGLFIVYAFRVTAFTPLNALSFVVALVFFFVEATALLMALTHTYESLDATCRVRWRRRIDHIETIPGYAPMISLHVPAYNEPPEMVADTLRSLAALDYPNYEVLVIDNNTPEEANWQQLNAVCQQLGPRFRFMHLDQWPGYKSGALNFALSQTSPQAEIVGSIDADYRLRPDFLKALAPAFANPKVAFVQTPQDYRDYQGDPYTESTYHGYKYFFEVSMPTRNEHNAIIFAGTMGLIRKSVLEEIGGWDEWCITEDAEASLRILKRGYSSVYIKHSYGYGLMPFTFEGLKKQRFRWCFGGIQILKKHWGSLMPWAHWVDPANRLTLAQRYYYLAGGLQWFTDVFNLLFAFFLVMGGISSILSGRFAIRPLTGPLLIMPAMFLFLHLWRFVWVLRHKLNLSWRTALRSMYNFFSLGWAVTLACFQGLIQKKGVFLRTPKTKSRSRRLQALQMTQWETLIGLACTLAGAGAFAAHPNIRTLSLGGLLMWQASLYLAAPYYSLLSVRAKRPEIVVQEHGASVLESWAAKSALAAVMVLLAAGAAAQMLPQPPKMEYQQYQPVDIPLKRLVGIERVPVEERDDTPTLAPILLPTQPIPLPSETPLLPTATEGEATSTPPPAASPTPSSTPSPAATPTPTSLGVTETPTSGVPPTDTPTPAAASSTPIITATLTMTYTLTPTP